MPENYFQLCPVIEMALAVLKEKRKSCFVFHLACIVSPSSKKLSLLSIQLNVRLFLMKSTKIQTRKQAHPCDVEKIFLAVVGLPYLLIYLQDLYHCLSHMIQAAHNNSLKTIKIRILSLHSLQVPHQTAYHSTPNLASQSSRSLKGRDPSQILDII